MCSFSLRHYVKLESNNITIDNYQNTSKLLTQRKGVLVQEDLMRPQIDKLTTFDVVTATCKEVENGRLDICWKYLGLAVKHTAELQERFIS